MSLRSELRQWWFPSELRIDDPGVAIEDLSFEDLERLLVPPPPPAPEAPPAPALSDDFAIKLATTAWKIASQATRLEGGGAARGVQGRSEYLAQILRSQELEFEDFSGSEFDEREVWDDIIASSDDLANPVVSSMQAPRISYQGRVLQRGTPVVRERHQTNHQGKGKRNEYS